MKFFNFFCILCCALKYFLSIFYLTCLVAEIGMVGTVGEGKKSRLAQFEVLFYIQVLLKILPDI